MHVKSVLILVLCVGCYAEIADISTLKMVHIIHRHGARNPLHSYPNDPYSSRLLYWKEGWGELINLGKNQLYELGLFIRQSYDEFLTPYYLDDLVYIRSTDVPRALMSAESLLAGLYPPENEQIWNTALPWQPIPVHTQPSAFDYLLQVEYVDECPRQAQELIVRDNLADIVHIQQDNALLYEYLSNQTGATIATPDNIYDLYDLLQIEEAKGLTLPDWTNGVYPDQMQTLYDFTYNYDLYTKELQRLQTGYLLYEAIQHMQNVSGTDQRMFIYSSHDTNVAAILLLLDLYNNKQPPLASAVILEMHSDPVNGEIVKIFYRNDTTVDPYLLTLNGCSEECPLSTFVNLTTDLIVTDVYTECKYSSSSPRNAFEITLSLLLFIALIFLK